MKVGIVALYWPPHFGGAEGYVYRLTKALRAKGVDAWGITATPESDSRDNGEEIVYRLGKETHADNKKACMEWFKLVIDHVREGDYTHIIVNSPLTHVSYGFTEKLFIGLSSLPVKIGIVHHDLGLRIRGRLEEEYKRFEDWEVAAMIVEDEQREYFRNTSSLFILKDAYWAFDSPLYFEPDFVIGNTEWSNRFIDPLNTTPKFVLHPLIEQDKTPIRRDEEKMEQVNITVMNPIYHKGRSIMADLVNTYTKSWTYRVMIGSYGGEKQDFFRMIEQSWAIRDGRVDSRKYVEDIREVYEMTDIFVYPSRYEGYGMAAVEPMLQGTPVIVHDYPAILEAVGDGANCLSWGCDSKVWEDEIEDMLLFGLEEWREKSLARGEFLLQRQEEEIDELIAFLGSV